MLPLLNQVAQAQRLSFRRKLRKFCVKSSRLILAAPAALNPAQPPLAALNPAQALLAAQLNPTQALLAAQLNPTQVPLAAQLNPTQVPLAAQLNPAAQSLLLVYLQAPVHRTDLMLHLSNLIANITPERVGIKIIRYDSLECAM